MSDAEEAGAARIGGLRQFDRQPFSRPSPSRWPVPSGRSSRQPARPCPGRPTWPGRIHRAVSPEPLATCTRFIQRRVWRRPGSSACASSRRGDPRLRPSPAPPNAAAISCRCDSSAARTGRPAGSDSGGERAPSTFAAGRPRQVCRRLLGRRRTQSRRGVRQDNGAGVDAMVTELVPLDATPASGDAPAGAQSARDAICAPRHKATSRRWRFRNLEQNSDRGPDAPGEPLDARRVDMTRHVSIEWPDAAPFHGRSVRRSGSWPSRIRSTGRSEDERSRRAVGPNNLIVGCGDLDCDHLSFLATVQRASRLRPGQPRFGRRWEASPAAYVPDAIPVHVRAPGGPACRSQGLTAGQRGPQLRGGANVARGRSGAPAGRAQHSAGPSR